jgi:hypothetical protein
MTKISVLYPNQKNAQFDIEYYLEKHMPLSIKLLSAHPGYRGYSVERGSTVLFLAKVHSIQSSATSCLTRSRASMLLSRRTLSCFRATYQLHRHPADLSSERDSDLRQCSFSTS